MVHLGLNIGYLSQLLKIFLLTKEFLLLPLNSLDFKLTLNSFQTFGMISPPQFLREQKSFDTVGQFTLHGNWVRLAF